MRHSTKKSKVLVESTEIRLPTEKEIKTKNGRCAQKLSKPYLAYYD